jgi:transposase
MKKTSIQQLKKAIASMEAGTLSQIHLDAAGIDLGSETHWVAVPPDRDDTPVRSFGCFTADLYAMAAWLKQCGVTTVAMESTGVYWIPVFQVLEQAGFEVKLANARHVKNVPGRKTDILDCQWLQRLHSYGLLSASFRPEDQICALRSYWRHRDTLVKYAAAHVQHMHKALTQMNLHMHKVLSDITGVTGMRIIRAIVAGERDPRALAAMRDCRVKCSQAEIMLALQGDYRPEHLFALQQALELFDFYHRQITACDIEVERCLARFVTRIAPQTHPLPARRGSKPRKQETHIVLHTHLHRITGTDFTQLPGLDVLHVQTIITEVGLNPAAWPSEKHFASWLGLCPNHKITGGKILDRRTRKVVNRAATAFRLAAQTLARSDCALGAFLRRIRARHGRPKAITATAHKLARLFYRLWKSGEAYVDQGAAVYEQRYQQRVLASMKRKAHALGYALTLEPLALAAPSI